LNWDGSINFNQPQTPASFTPRRAAPALSFTTNRRRENAKIQISIKPPQTAN